MIKRRLNGFCLTVAAVLGLAAAWTPSALAIGETFHSVVEPTVLTGTNYEIDGFGKETVFEGEHSIVSGMFSVKCTTTTVSGTWSDLTPETMTLHPTYQNCKDAGGGAASIETTGCNFIYWAEVLGGSGAKVEVECDAGKTINVKTATCTLTVGKQANLGATYTNGKVGEKGDITVKSAFGLGFTKDGICMGLDGTKSQYTGSWTVGGYKDICEPAECPFAPGGLGDKDAYKEGEVVEIWWE